MEVVVPVSLWFLFSIPVGLDDDGRGLCVELVLPIPCPAEEFEAPPSPLVSAADTGTAAPDAERRVDDVAARANQDINRARSSAVILAFMAGAATLLGAIAAWAAAVTGGRYRDGREAVPALWDWGTEPRSPFSKTTR